MSLIDDKINVYLALEVLRIGSLLAILVHVWKSFTLEWEGLIVHNVPVQYIEFGVGHRIQVFEDELDGLLVPCCVDHEASVLETWLVSYLSLLYLLS